MKKILYLLGLVALTGCATGAKWVPQSGRDVQAPRNISPLSRQHIVLLVSNECAPAIAVFTIDHTTLETATIILQDSSHTVEIRRPMGAGDYGYWMHVVVKAYDSRGEEIGLAEHGPWGVDTYYSGHQKLLTVDKLDSPNGATCTKKARKRSGEN
ncbi:hypothetical protein KW800_00895 [Candidatus Parcubacteria bacterium]|nr:hypothetical protein [Candidatus Parcubacteria bacterium]